MRKKNDSAANLPYSLFVSYASVDNESGWVDVFVDTLKKKLNAQLGNRDTNRVWFDRDRIDPNSPLTPQIASRVRESRLLMVLLSPGYIASRWCSEERATFLKKNANAIEQGRIVLVDLGRPGLDQRPKEFGDLRGTPFFEPSANDRDVGSQLGIPKPNLDFESHQPFFAAMDVLVQSLAEPLQKLA